MGGAITTFRPPAAAAAFNRADFEDWLPTKLESEPTVVSILSPIWGAMDIMLATSVSRSSQKEEEKEAL